MKNARLLLIPLLLLASVAGAADEPLRLEPGEKDLAESANDWYGVYSLQGSKVGFAHITADREGEHYVARVTMEMRVEAMGQKVAMKLVQEDRFAAAAPYPWLGCVMDIEGQMSTRSEVKEGKVVTTIRSAAGEHSVEKPAPDYRLADVMTPGLWMRKGVKVGDSVSTRTFNPQVGDLDVQSLAVTGMTKGMVNGIETVTYTGNASSKLMGPLGVMRFSGDGKMLSWQFGGFLELRLEPEAVAKKLDAGGDLFVAGFAKVDQNLGDPKTLSEVILEARGAGAEALAPGPRQEVVRENGKTILRLGKGRGGAVKADPAEIFECLEETVEFPIEDPAVVALAKEAVGDAVSSREKVERLVRFVHEYVEDALRPELVPVLQIVKDRRGDCSEHSFLFVTLARAAGIPARLVFGVIYMGDMLRAFGGHAWAEVAIDLEWIPVDPTWNEVDTNPTHVRCGAGVQAYAASMMTLGQLEFLLVSKKAAE